MTTPERSDAVSEVVSPERLAALIKRCDDEMTRLMLLYVDPEVNGIDTPRDFGHALRELSRRRAGEQKERWVPWKAGDFMPPNAGDYPVWTSSNQPKLARVSGHPGIDLAHWEFKGVTAYLPSPLPPPYIAASDGVAGGDKT
jgi:hypothetical protein